MKDAPARYVRDTLQMTAGMLIWAVHLGIVYGIAALACARRFAGATLAGVGVVPLAVSLATVVALAAAAVVLVLALRHEHRSWHGDYRRFRDSMTAFVAGAALVAIAWSGLPALLVPACG